MSDDLDNYHFERLKRDPAYRRAHELFEMGEAISRLRLSTGLTRSQLGKRLKIAASMIKKIEEDTPSVPIDRVESVLHYLLGFENAAASAQEGDRSFLEHVHHLRSTLFEAA